MRTTSAGTPRAAARLVFALALASLGAAAPSGPKPREEVERPAPGRLLVATESIRGSIFHHSVVYLLSYGQNGAMGLIVNHPTDVALHEVVQGAVEGSGMLHLGGPVQTNSVMILLRADSQPEHASRVADDVFVSAHPDVLVERAASPDPGTMRVFAGYAGWGPRQLDGEIARGQWIVVSAPSQAIFDEETDALWKKLFRRHHRLITSLGGPRFGS